MFSKAFRLVLLIGTLLWAFQSTAQYSYYSETTGDFSYRSGISVKLGGTTFLGDLGGNRGAGKPFIKDFNSKTVRPLIGVTYSYFPNSWLSTNIGLHYTWVTGADSLITEKTEHSAGRFERNLSFKSAITELSADVEFYPLQTLPQFSESSLRPFVGTGIGLFHFNPKAHLYNEWFELQPLHLEGQGFAEYPERKNYKRTQVYMPLSLGFKYKVTNNYFFSLSTTFRKTFTDYIDDVSTSYVDPSLFDKYLSRYDATVAKQLYYRGNSTTTPSPSSIRGYSSSKDSYTSIVFTITYLFDRSDNYYYHTP